MWRSGNQQTQTYFQLSLGSAKNNVCKPESENDFCDIGILRQSHFSSNNLTTTARGICVDWLPSVQIVMFLGLELSNEHQKNALKFVIDKKKDVFVKLPTAFGKSVIFQALPLLYACVEPCWEKM